MENENFHNFKTVKDNYQERVLNLFKEVKEKYENVNFISIFGELFGGQYPHEKVEKNKNEKIVQKGIYYAPHTDFYAFDIMINNEFYLNVEEINILFEKHNFLYAKTLFKDSLEACLKYTNEFESKIPEWLGLPPLPKNICEGVVIKPLETKFLKIGDRVIIKNKNEKWSENKRFIDKKLLAEEQEELSEEAQLLKEEIYKMITENRLNNVLSKIGSISKNDYGRVLGLFSKDVLEEFEKSFGESFETLDKVENKIIKKFLNTEAGNLIINFFENNL